MTLNYTNSQLKFIAASYGKMTIEDIAETIGKPTNSVQRKIVKLGIDRHVRMDVEKDNVTMERWCDELKD